MNRQDAFRVVLGPGQRVVVEFEGTVRIPCYVAAPYGAATAEQIEANIGRAVQLGRWSVAAGFAPVIPHLPGRAEVYGCAQEQDDGTSRRIALECGVAQARMVAVSGGVFLAITRDDGSLSDGVRMEMEAFRAAAREGASTWIVLSNTWARWSDIRTRETALKTGIDAVHKFASLTLNPRTPEPS